MFTEKKAEELEFYSLDVNFRELELNDAISLGVKSKHLTEKTVDNGVVYQVCGVINTKSISSQVLNVGDIIINVDGKPVEHINDINIFWTNKPDMKITVMRDCQEVTLTIPSLSLQDKITKDILYWSGGIIQQVYPAIYEQVKEIPSNIIVSHVYIGTPITQAGIRSKCFITEVNGEPVTTFDKFLQTIKEAESEPPKKYVTLTTIDLTGITELCAVKLDTFYQPTMEFKWDETHFTWQQIKHSKE